MAGFGPKVGNSGGGGSQGQGQIPNDTTAPDPTLSAYSEALAVAPGVETTILTFVAPVGDTTHAVRYNFGGDSIAKFRLLYDGAPINQYITWYGGNLTGEWDYKSGISGGQEIPAGTVVTVTVLLRRGAPSDFFARLEYITIN